LATVVAAFAQEGHPLKGSWIGDWGPNKTDRNQITIVIDWDGKQVTGILNPGPGAIPIQKASLEPKGWIVHFEVDAKNAAGQTALRRRWPHRKSRLVQSLDRRDLEPRQRERRFQDNAAITP